VDCRANCPRLEAKSRIVIHHKSDLPVLIVVIAVTLGGVWAVPCGAVAALYNLRAAPVASFVWSPQLPQIGDPVTVTSTSSARGSPVTSFAWDFSDNGPFGAFREGGPVGSVAYATPGSHVVRLRVTAADGLSSVAAARITMTAPPASARVLYPFPIVSIRGTDFPLRVRIKRLAVRAPVGARIAVTCGHARCPARAAGRTAPAKAGRETWVPFRRFERSFPAGAVLEVRVTQPGKIGSYTRFHVRRRRFPARSDSCLDTAGVKPIACPRS
jgi:PKD repeat protein